MHNLQSLSTDELLRLFGDINEELRTRQVLRSSNNPVADYAEWLAQSKLGCRLLGNSAAGHDALDASGQRIQIEARRRTRHNASVQLSQLRRLDADPFDVLLGIVFNSDFYVDYAAIAPVDLVKERARYRSHTNAWVFHMRRDLLENPAVTDVTSKLLSTEAA